MTKKVIILAIIVIFAYLINFKIDTLIDKNKISDKNTSALLNKSINPSIKSKNNNTNFANIEAINLRIDHLFNNQKKLLLELSKLKKHVSQLNNSYNVYNSSAQAHEDKVFLENTNDTSEDIVTRTVSFFDETLEKQKEDKDWSSSVLSTIQKDIEQNKIPGTQLADVDCKTTFCRIEFNHVDSNANEIFNENYIFETSGNYSSYFDLIHLPNGSITTIMYMSRDGYDLPSIEGSNH